MREEIWTEKIFKDDAGYFLRITKGSQTPFTMSSEKDSKMFFSIKEVADMFNVNETLLRYWEREFPQISPKKGGRGVRFYSKDDIEQIRTIYDLVKGRGLKLAAARELLKKNKEGTQQTLEVVKRLKEIREELVTMKKAVEGM